MNKLPENNGEEWLEAKALVPSVLNMKTRRAGSWERGRRLAYSFKLKAKILPVFDREEPVPYYRYLF